MGRLTLHVLLSFAQFERELTGERIRDKIAASKQKGLWMGGQPPLGYDVQARRLIVNAARSRDRAVNLPAVPASWVRCGPCADRLARRRRDLSKRRVRHDGGIVTGGQTSSTVGRCIICSATASTGARSSIKDTSLSRSA